MRRLEKITFVSVIIKDPECWSSLGLNPVTIPPQRMSTLPTELTRQRFLIGLLFELKRFFFFISAIPFIKNPEQNVAFEMYFQRAWQDTFFLSLYNFLITLFHHMHILYQLWGICNQTVVWYILNQNPDLNPSQKRSSFSMQVTSTRN